MLILIIIIVLVVIFVRRKNKIRKANELKRYNDLLEKYKDKSIVDKIISKQVWQGMKKEQLRDSWGEPSDVDNKVYKTKIEEVWKYGLVAKNRYKQKVMLENEIVVGWENK